MSLLEHKVAVITGAGRGIGRACALAFAREGARVAVNDTGAELDGSSLDPAVAQAVADEVVAQGGEALADATSVKTRAGARALMENVVARFGRVDVLVNCAGISLDEGLFKIGEESWNEMMQVHVGASLWCLQAAGEHMRRQGSGAVVMTTSSAGFLGNFGQAAHAAASSAIHGLMRTAGIELQRHGVRVNAVAPLAKTRATRSLPLFEHTESMTPEHVAPLYVYLASDLSKDVTGSVFSAAGGRISSYRFSEAMAGFKEADASLWTATEIAEHFAMLRR